MGFNITVREDFKHRTLNYIYYIPFSIIFYLCLNRLKHQFEHTEQYHHIAQIM